MNEAMDGNEPLMDGVPVPPEAFRRPCPPEGLRDRVLAQTGAVVRRRRRARRGLLIAVLAAAYAGGAGTALWLAPEAAAPAASPVLTAAAPAPPAVPAAETPVPALPDEILRDSERFTLLLNRVTPERRLELLQEAGNRWLDDYGDVERAVTCYRQFLDQAPPGRLAEFHPNENWLLRSLRLARLEEKSHDNAPI